MNRLPLTIEKNTLFKPGEDYYRLRREGIGFIEQMGSRRWTDYNTHDPGITILEALCFAMTDLVYRTGWDMKDLLASSPLLEDPNTPYPHQAFFTPREILTVNPWAPNDFRRLLIDLDLVRNAWVLCKECACDLPYYAWCEENELRLSYQKPDNPSLIYKKVEPVGLYDVLLELENDAELGDLNDRKIVQKYTLFDESSGASHPLTLELRFPVRELHDPRQYENFIDSPHTIETITMRRFAPHKLDGDGIVGEDLLKKGWRNTFYTSLEITLGGMSETVFIHDATLRLYGNPILQDHLKVQEQSVTGGQYSLQQFLEDPTETGFVYQYGRKLVAVKAQIEKAKTTLHGHRNLDEDYCHIRGVDVEEVAVCADVQVAPDADIERVQAQIWLEIERYFNPSVPFYTLQELTSEGIPIEEIFKGPKLNNGFIKEEELEVAGLKPLLRTSDIINRLMDLEGVIAVNNLSLSKYDKEGNVVKGVADPKWKNETRVFDPNQISASWVLLVSSLHQPRLYHNQSRFLFYKVGLPFLPRMDEAFDTLTQLRGEAERPKLKNASNDVTIPKGTFRSPEEYSPVQYSFPLTYGIGPEGLPSHVSLERRGQAKQLKAYMMVFEQLLGNAFAQLAGVEKLFSLDPAVMRTYFVQEFKEEFLNGYTEITKDLDKSTLEDLTESLPEFHERRNRFLDHLMARFGEQFGEYTLMLTNWQGHQVALDQLILDKISFLKDYPFISHDRAKAFNYKTDPCSPDNVPGLKKRVSLLLGNSIQERAIVVEHLLLRPKFPGDALYPVCTEGPCEPCGDEDPYSFRLTFVVPGWTIPFHSNLEMRRFADRTIRQETPSHLLAKICWVGNDGFMENPCHPVLDDVVEQLVTKGKTSEGTGPSDAEACECAKVIYAAFSQAFKNWFQDKTLDYFHPVALKAALENEFQARVKPTSITCTTILVPGLWVDIGGLMVAHFQDVALNGRQFERFEEAWCKWLEINAKFDWTETSLQESVEAILVTNVMSLPASKNLKHDELCKSATSIVTKFGMNFYRWMEKNFKDGKSFKDFDFSQFTPGPVQLSPDFSFKSETSIIIGDFLKDRYSAYQEVSYRLRIVVNLLAKLHNVYPGATLHDCDDGSDVNPVRLGQTALGNYPTRQKVSPSESDALAGPQQERTSQLPEGADRLRRAKATTVKSQKRSKPKSSS